MNRAKKTEAIKLLTLLNEHKETQLNGTIDSNERKKLNSEIALNLRRIEKLRDSSYDFTNVKKPEDLDKLKPKPREWD